MKKSLSQCVFSLALCFLLRGDASALTGCVDQAIETQDTAGILLDAETEVGQTIICRLGGTIEYIEVLVTAVGAPSGMLVVGVYSTVSVDGFSVPEELLAERTMNLSGLGAPAYVAVDFNGANLRVEAGEALAVVVRASQAEPDPANYAEWIGDSLDGYADGMAYFRWFNIDPAWQIVTNENGDFVDLGLRIYLDCTTPVEMTTWSAVKTLYR
jgi:hypothetical protein